MFRIPRGLMRKSLFEQFDKKPLMTLQKCAYHSLFINPPNNEVPELTTSRLTEIFASEIGQAKEYSKAGIIETEKQREELMELLPAVGEALPPRNMKDSFLTAVIPLKCNAEIRERYVTTGGKVRIGRLLEDLDVFAVCSCFKHILNPRSVGKQNPYSVVTALVNSMYFVKGSLEPSENVRFSGHVTHTGTSSMEVSIVVDQMDDKGVYQKFCNAAFLMVARDPLNKGSARINPLVAKNQEEAEFLKKGAARQQLRKQHEGENIFKKPPNEDERKIIHDNFVRKMIDPLYAPENTRKMKATYLKTVLICQPQNRNRYNKIFGGFIMRNAYELAFTSVMIYGKKRPDIFYIDNIKFHIPVEIGSILRFSSHIGYVEKNFVHTVVIAETVEPTGEIRKSNEFYFTFRFPREESDEPIKGVDYETYEEAIKYLISRRHFKRMTSEFGNPSFAAE